MKWVVVVCAVGAACGLIGCQRPMPKPEPAPDPLVLVTSPRIDEVVDYEEFTGRTDAIRQVELRSRVTGYLQQVHFQDGAQVEAGALLFTIDDRLYRAELDRAEANVRLAEARLERLERDFERAKSLRATASISDEEYDRFESDFTEGQASLKVAQAAQRSAEQNLNYTKITAPMPGLMSRRFIDPGNLIKADDTPLSLLVVRDPMFVYFDIDDRTLLALRRAVAKEQLPVNLEEKTSVDIALPDEEQYTLKGQLNFIDNKLDAGTGTIRLRAEVANPKNLLTPGLFVRVRLPTAPPTRQLLVPDAAVTTDQGLKVIYAVNDANEVVRRRIRVLGKAYGSERALIESDVQSSDRVIVEGQQRVRAGIVVNPQPWTRSGSPTVNKGNPVAGG